jgi:16S rRNA (cytosine967-C5)-methyltransferase
MHPKVLIDSCAELVKQLLTFDHPADAVVSRYFRENRSLGPRERHSLSETAFAVLRYKLRFEHMAPSGSGSRERRLAILGFAHVLDEEARTPSPGGAQGGRGHRDFLNGGLNDTERQWLDRCDAVKASELMDRHRHNLPEWLVQPLKAQLGGEFWAFTDSLNRLAPLDLRVNTLKAERKDIHQELTKAGFANEATPYSPWGLRLQGKPSLQKLDAFVRGAIEVQDEGSQLLAALLDAKRGEMVADFCAGAGGKTLAIGASMRNTGRLYAFDTSAHRLDALKPRLARSGLSNVHPAAIAHERDDRIKRLAGKMDRVLVDAPCSGLGTLRRNPDIKWRQSAAGVAQLHARQLAILNSAARLVKPGGRLVYATCSLLPEENEAVALAFCAAQKSEWVLLDVGDLLTRLKVAHADRLCAPLSGPFDGDVGTTSSSGDCTQRVLRLWPHRHGSDGFFAAVWQRKS